ncbi:MAG: TonB-dependent receptor [Gemmatimonadota bacterium]|nr:TonB-dependent receptor [Gemmatimonadota bacterium]
MNKRDNRRARPDLKCLLVAGPALVLGAAAAVAQETAEERSPATVIGQVVNSTTGLPVDGAVVTLLGSTYGAITDSLGNFRIPQTWAGRDTVEVRFIGYEPSKTVIDIAPNEITRVTLLLSQTVVRVADLVVEVRQTRRSRNLQAFVERMDRGFGEFFTPRDIRNRNPRLPSDLFRGVQGVQVGPIRYGKAQVTIGRGTRLGCSPAVYLDGVYQAGMDVDDIPAEDLGAVELYKSMTDTPMEFMRSSSTCGAIVIWTPATIDFQDWDGQLPDPYDD